MECESRIYELAALLTAPLVAGQGDISRTRRGRPRRARGPVPAKDHSCLWAAMKASTDAIVFVDMGLRIIDTNEAAVDLLGYRNGPKIIGLSALDLLMPDARDIARRNIEETLGGGILRHRQYSARRADGTPVPVEVSVEVTEEAAGVPSGFACVFKDLTEEMKYRDALITQTEFLRTMIDTIPNPVFYKDADGRYLGCNRAFAQFLGVSEGEIVGRTIHEITPGHIADTYYDMDAEMCENPGRQHYEWKVKNKCGEERNVLFDKTTFDDASGKIKGVIGVITDITDRKLMEDALDHDHAELRVIFEAIPDAVVFTDKSMRITMANRVFAQLFGYRDADAYGSPFDLLRASPEGLAGAGTVPPATGSSDAPRRQETEYRKTNGDIFLGDTVTTPIRDGCGNIMGTLVIIRDVTESKRADEAIGALAAGVAHDFNDLLTAIRGHCDTALTKAGDSSSVRKNLEQIACASDLAADLVRQLLVFSREYPKDQSTIDLGEMVPKMLKTLSASIGDSISITARVDADLWSVRGDRAGLEQVLMNLVINASDAMPRGGQITICAENIEREAMAPALLRKAGPKTSPSGFVRLAVMDDGIGMNQETLSHVCGPSFGARKCGRGNALGLSVAYATVQRHGGWIDACSEPGEGTAFWVYLPALRAVASVPAACGEQGHGRFGEVLCPGPGQRRAHQSDGGQNEG
jgi:PAS domain S-box-containing protein